MNFFCESISNENELGGKSYVGMLKNESGYSIVTPYGLILPGIIEATEKEKIHFLKKYIHSIMKALSKDKTRQYLQEDNKMINQPMAALKVVFDYVQNGAYREYENEVVIRETGKINFKKTFAKVKPFIQNEEVLYTKFAVTRKREVEQELVCVAQGNVINHFMENGGEILFGNLIHVNVPKIIFNNTLLSQLQKIKANSFNSRKQQLIQWIMDYIKGASNIREKGDWQYAIIASTLWEEMIDSCYSNQVYRDKTKYGRVFRMVKDGRVVKTSAPTQHDTIYETEKELVIIDAKMYYSVEQLIKSDVLEKQFGYYLSAKQKNASKKIINVLIKPYVEGVDEEEGFLGEIPSPEIVDDRNNRILIYAVKFDKVMNAYYMGKKISEELLDDANKYLSG